VELSHARRRIEGAVGVLWRAGSAVAVCAHRCGLSGLPDAIAGLSRLERLDVGDNRITALPELPASLRELYVYDNQLAALPALPKLIVLDANRNQLADLPALAGIDFVYLAANRLRSPPPIRGVRYLNVSNNPLVHLALDDAAIEELRASRRSCAASRSSDRGAARARPARQPAHRPARLDRVARAAAHARPARKPARRAPEELRSLPLTKLDLRWNPLRARPDWLDELSRRGCLVYT